MNSADIFSLTKIVLKNLKREAEKKFSIQIETYSKDYCLA